MRSGDQLLCQQLQEMVNGWQRQQASVAVAVADVFSKNYHSIPNKIDKILKIFDRLDNVKSRGVIFYT